jgi:hypothetical protein
MIEHGVGHKKKVGAFGGRHHKKGDSLEVIQQQMLEHIVNAQIETLPNHQ